MLLMISQAAPFENEIPPTGHRFPPFFYIIALRPAQLALKFSSTAMRWQACMTYYLPEDFLPVELQYFRLLLIFGD